VQAVPEEVAREAAATGDQPPRMVSPEFFFLLQRIDRLDERLTGEIKALAEKLTGETSGLDQHMREADDRLMAQIRAVDDRLREADQRLTGQIRAVDDRLKETDHRLTEEIRAVYDRLSAELKGLDEKFSNRLDGLRFWTITAVVTITAGFVGTIVVLAVR